MRLVVGIYYFVSTSSHWGDRGFVRWLRRGGASGSALPGRAWERIEVDTNGTLHAPYKLSGEVFSRWVIGDNCRSRLFWIKLFAFIHVQVYTIAL